VSGSHRGEDLPTIFKIALRSSANVECVWQTRAPRLPYRVRRNQRSNRSSFEDGQLGCWGTISSRVKRSRADFDGGRDPEDRWIGILKVHFGQLSIVSGAIPSAALANPVPAKRPRLHIRSCAVKKISVPRDMIRKPVTSCRQMTRACWSPICSLARRIPDNSTGSGSGLHRELAFSQGQSWNQ